MGPEANFRFVAVCWRAWEDQAGAAVVDVVGSDAAGDFGKGFLQGEAGGWAVQGDGFASGGAGAAGLAGVVFGGGAGAGVERVDRNWADVDRRSDVIRSGCAFAPTMQMEGICSVSPSW